MKIPPNKKKLLAGFILISVIFIILRIKTLGHLLMWDEAWNILTLRAFLSSAKADPFYWGYFFHPPFYMTFAQFLAPFQSGFDIRLESLSLIFSYLTLSVTYLLSARIGGWKYAWISGLLLSLMPMSIGYDTWIKRDGLASALCYIAVLLLIKKKFFWCAIALSFALLSKESALFFIIAVVPILLLLREKITVKKIAVICATIFIFTSWWYILFSSLTKTVFKIYFQATDYYMLWTNSPLYLFKKLLPDLGAAMLFFFIIGIFYILYLMFRGKQFRWGIPLIIIAVIYILSSAFIKAKAPWLCLSARPALAMASGAGVLLLIKMSKRSKLLLGVLLLSFIYVVHAGLAFSYPQYHMETHPNGWPGAEASKKLALYLNEHMRDDDRLMITEFAYWSMPVCAVFLYYWKGCPIEIIHGQESAGNVIKEIVKNRISWFVVVDSPHPTLNFHQLVKDASGSVLGKPVSVGWSYVWDTRSLLSDGDVRN